MKVRRQNSAENTQGGDTGSPTDGDERRGRSENPKDDSDSSFATEGDFTPNSTCQLYLRPRLFSRVTCCFLAAEWYSVSPGPGWLSVGLLLALPEGSC